MTAVPPKPTTWPVAREVVSSGAELLIQSAATNLNASKPKSGRGVPDKMAPAKQQRDVDLPDCQI